MRRGVRAGALLLTVAFGLSTPSVTVAQQGQQAPATAPQTNTAVFQVEGMT